MKHFKEGSTICTGRINGQRYEIKRAGNGCCGSAGDSYCFCFFFEKGDCEDLGGWPLCSNHEVYFVKIEEDKDKQ